MAAETLKSVLIRIRRQLEADLGSADWIDRIWLYRGLCVVVDLRYRGVGFALNFFPLSNSLILVNAIERKHSATVVLIPGANGRKLLSRGVTLDQARALLQDWLAGFRSIIDDQLDASEEAKLPRLSPHAPPRSPAPRRVGVMTLPLNANYGGNLQAFAMMQALAKLGHAPVFINRRHPELDDEGNPRSVPFDTTSSVMGSSIGLGARVPNVSFTDHWLLPMTRIFASSEDLRANASRLGVDAIVVGSDQIWRPRFAKSVLPDLFLAFLPEDSQIRRISYAASFGTARWELSKEQTLQAKEWVKRFDAISVREDSAVNLAKQHLDVSPQHVLDPTLLLLPEDYDPVICASGSKPEPNRLRTYILDMSDATSAFVDALAPALRTTPCMTSGLPFPLGDAISTVERSIIEDKSVGAWVAAIRSASFVATDSFHGVAFSILFNKPFIAYGNRARGLARFSSLLTQVGLQDRLVFQSEEMSIEHAMRPIDWDAVNARLQKLRVESFQFLENAINGIPPKGGGNGGGAPSKAVENVKPTNVTSMGVPERVPRLVHEAGESGPRAEGSNPLNVLCTGCGACITESKGALSLVWDRDGFMVPKANGLPIPSETIRVCPFNPAPEAAVVDEDRLGQIFLGDAGHYDPNAGYYRGSYIGYSKKFREGSSSGGVATYVLEQLLKSAFVDWLYVVESDGFSGYRYNIVRNAEDVKRTSKTRYYPVTLEELFSIIEETPGRVAVTGVACFVKAIRLKQHYHPHLRERIPFIIGIICGGLKSRSYTDFLSQSAGIDGSYKDPQYRVKHPDRSASDYSFAALNSDNQHHSVRMQTLGDMWGTGMFKAKACDFCTDVLTELADISLGDAWLPDYRADGLGNNVIITRSRLADLTIREGIASGDLVLDEVPVKKIAQSQMGGFKHKRSSIQFRVWMGRKKGLPIPYIRPRLSGKVTMVEAMVQVLRERTRAESLRIWSASASVTQFSRRMRSRLRTLREVTLARNEGHIPVEKLLKAMGDTEAGAAPELASQPVLRRWLRRGRVLKHSKGLERDLLPLLSDWPYQDSPPKA